MSNDKDFVEADRLYDEQRYKEAFEVFLRLARNGDPHSCVRIGEMFYGGKGVPVDLEQSIVWDLEARRLGEPLGTHNLALTYIRLGKYDLARQYLEEVCVVDNGEARLDLAKLLVNQFGDMESGLRVLNDALQSKNMSEMTYEEALSLKRTLIGQ